MKHPKYFICPMSKNITDAVISMKSDEFGLLPTRRQIDFDGGYVNGWSTYDFHKYVRSKSGIILERDHSGAKQGVENDNGYDTFTADANLFDIIHIDPWKLHHDKTAGAMETMRNMDYIYNRNHDNLLGVGGGQLRFDFIIVINEAITLFIELDGIQHSILKTFGSDLEKAQVNFQSLQANDKIKNDYCKKIIMDFSSNTAALISRVKN